MINRARNLLENIVYGNITTKDVVETIKKDALCLLEGKRNIYLCGKLPWVSRMYKELCEKKKEGMPEFFLVDLVDEDTLSVNELPGLLNEESVCVICSRAHFADYYEVIKESACLFYPAFLLSQETQLDKKEKYGYNCSAVIELIDNVVKNAKTYLELLDCLEDDESKRILSAILLFRTSFTLNLTKDIKTKGIHYWDEQIYKFTDDDIIVDAGGFTGDSLGTFLEGGLHCKQYNLFEPTDAIYEAEQYATKALFEVILHKCGLYSYDGTLSFALRKDNLGQLSGVSQIDMDGEVKIPVSKLTSKMKETPSFVKMDVEGSELEVLAGAEGIVSDVTSYAICAYHKVNDIVEIYQWLKEKGTYRYYMRAERNNLMVDFVLYAISKNK